MRITFLIGNGFDINLGLDTRYTDFLKSYREIRNTDSELLKYFKNEVLGEKELWANAEEAFGIITEKFKRKGYDAEAYCECHEDFCNNLAKYLIAEEQRINYTEKSTELAGYLSTGLLNYKKGFRENEINQIEEVENTIGNALFFNFINFNYTQTLDLAIETLKKNSSFLGKRKHSNTLYNNMIGTLIHVHGTVHKDMVLGVNDLSQISDTSIFEGFGDEYISQIIKQKTNEMNDDNIDRKAYEVLKNSDIIYIYGMSTGVTDKLWWERICELMNKNKKLQLFIYKHNAPEDGLIRRKTISYFNKERKAFTSYSSLDDDTKRDIEQRIHIDKSNVFMDLKDIAKNEKDKITS